MWPPVTDAYWSRCLLTNSASGEVPCARALHVCMPPRHPEPPALPPPNCHMLDSKLCLDLEGKT